MSRILPAQRLIFVAQAGKQRIKNWKEGVSLSDDSGCSISELLCFAAADRWHLAYQQRYHANKLLKSKPPHNRSAVSRYYYAMYHAMRACIYIFHQGDDHEQHSELPKHIPPDFPPGVDWQNKLKNARLIRNRADYEAYPKSDKAWRGDAESMKADADLLLSRSREYLRSKGCKL